MLQLIKNTELYAPQYKGKKDILTVNDRIVKIEDEINITGIGIQVVDGTNTKCIPGIIDRHVHITGGGGEGGFASSTPEVQISTIIQQGITTVVGLLGTNDLARNTKNLLAKAKALREEGLNAYILTGGYGYPPNTITDDIRDDIMYFNEVLGLKLAIEDHRSSYVMKEELKRLAAHVRVASMLSKKHGFIHLHMGNGQGLYEMIYEILNETDLPISLFSPTHINRNTRLLDASIEFAKRGGLVDITSNINLVTEGKTITPSKALVHLLNHGVDIDQITISSDAHGSMPVFDENGQFIGLEVAGFEPTLHTLRDLVNQEGLPIDQALRPFTMNPAKGLGISHERGVIVENGYADLVLLDEKLHVRDVFVGGIPFMKNYEIVKKGMFE
ncbi:beta-aspartyl-peptidase [Paenibacillus sp. 102]|uniref:beta-aspartyl-peptidase n=1 Tax=Paenibacillus sp. 102 TaxID=3120823 RepID=UPI0031BAF863